MSETSGVQISTGSSIIYYIYFIQIPMCQYIVINTSLRLDQLRVTALVQTVA